MNIFSFFTKTVGRKISLGYMLAVVLTVIIGAISYTSIGRLNETAERVDHTYLVLGQLAKIISGLEDAETGQRGFLITNLDTYLEPYNRADTTVDEAITAVRELTLDNPRQQARLDTLGPLIEEKQAELQETIDLRRNEGFEAAQAVVLTDKGKAVMDEIRDLINDMSEERGSVARRTQRRRQGRLPPCDLHDSADHGPVDAVLNQHQLFHRAGHCYAGPGTLQEILSGGPGRLDDQSRHPVHR